MPPARGLWLGVGVREVAAVTGDAAAVALGLPRRADVAAVENEPVMGAPEQVLGNVAHERLLRVQRCLGVAGEAYAVGHPKHVGIDCHTVLAEGHRKHYVGRLAPHAGQRQQCVEVGRHFAAVFLHEFPCHQVEVMRFAVGVAHRADVGEYLLGRRLGHRLRGGVAAI